MTLNIGQATAHPVTGTHDTFRHGLTSAAQSVSAGTASPLQARLEKVSLALSRHSKTRIRLRAQQLWLTTAVGIHATAAPADGAEKRIWPQRPIATSYGDEDCL